MVEGKRERREGGGRLRREGREGDREGLYEDAGFPSISVPRG